MITKDYFINDINLPAQNLENIQNWIDKFEKEILIKTLGYQLYNEFITGLAEEEPLQKWLDLRDGKIFEINGIKYKWNGLLNDDKISMLSYYVFSEYINNLSQTIGTNGVYKILSENADGISPSNLIVQSWNNAKKLQLLSKESIFNFILYTNAKEMTYDNWIFTALESKNNFGI